MYLYVMCSNIFRLVIHHLQEILVAPAWEPHHLGCQGIARAAKHHMLQPRHGVTLQGGRWHTAEIWVVRAEICWLKILGPIGSNHFLGLFLSNSTRKWQNSWGKSGFLMHQLPRRRIIATDAESKNIIPFLGNCVHLCTQFHKLLGMA